MSCSSSFSLMSRKARPSMLLTERTPVLLPCPAAGARASCARRAHSTNVRSTPDQQQVERPLKIWHPQQLLKNMVVPDSHRRRHSPQRHFEGGVGDTRQQSIPSKTRPVYFIYEIDKFSQKKINKPFLLP